MAHYRMLIDADKCLNCRACIVACQQRNGVPLGYSRNWVRKGAAKLNSGTGFQPGACMHCEKPLCVEACPTRATWKDTDGVVRVDKSRCIGCGSCVAACPYDARYRNPVTGVADKCDYCSGSRAFGDVPACVKVCATHVRMFGDTDDPDSEVAKAMKARKTAEVESTRTPTKPTLGYVSNSLPADWPREASIPGSIAAMRFLSTGVRWLGGLTLLGLCAVFLKNLILPPHDTPGETSGSGEGKQ